MNYFNHQNVQLAYEAVYNQDLCESMEDLGLIDDYDYIDEAKKELPVSRMAKQARRLAFSHGTETASDEGSEGNVPHRNIAKALRTMARIGGREVKHHIKKGYAQGTQYDPYYQELNRRNPDRNKYDEQVELYNTILEYLIQEGYADTLGSAEIILENMSEDWIEEILDEGAREERQVRRHSGTVGNYGPDSSEAKSSLRYIKGKYGPRVASGASNLAKMDFDFVGNPNIKAPKRSPEYRARKRAEKRARRGLPG